MVQINLYHFSDQMVKLDLFCSVSLKNVSSSGASDGGKQCKEICDASFSLQSLRLEQACPQWSMIIPFIFLKVVVGGQNSI